MVLTAMVGFAGLNPTIHAIKAGKTICLANKETLVVAGELILQLAQQYHTPILPVDSEHSAIFQSLVGEDQNPIEKILLTASGGPFRLKSMEEIAHVTKADALRHPLRCGCQADPGARSPTVDCTFCRTVPGWIGESPVGSARYASAHPVCLLVSSASAPEW